MNCRKSTIYQKVGLFKLFIYNFSRICHIRRLVISNQKVELIIEKKKLPRYKPCGGGVTRRASNILPFDFNHVVEDYSLTAKILLNNKEVFSKAFDSPVVSMVMRDKFDIFLINKAKEQGVVKYKTKFLSIDGDPGRLTVKTSKGYYKTNIIVGADGVLSKVAKELKLNGSSHKMVYKI